MKVVGGRDQYVSMDRAKGKEQGGKKRKKERSDCSIGISKIE